ncbi:GNAT family N-acetyltransferase [Antarcticirhabdus aurantiaca]|uniref:GNAT family N-acetyltransferase n=1 Tax=Antarcticirhabdus aurantiaca TaxID=2606717 RepID=A0ACD4NW63_9HYPH|nr:GNAT family N-acetyltransferase [Antarcticirhabdus aurantiaca]WAJ30867.1 GNAT family N-acetyltransferase [Jeongeuplla avenae]
MTDRRRSAKNDDTQAVSIAVSNSLSAIPAETWNRLAATDGIVGPDGLPDNPFLSHQFLSALEDSGCVGGRSGWQPQHLLLQDPDGSTVGVAPAYAKSHSQGEYVFDHGWADAFERAGGDYYPKLQLSVPFTPATGPRFLVGSEPGAEARRATLAAGVEAYVRQTGISSAHATFLEADDLGIAEASGWLHRTDQQFHFVNRGYGSYDDFLDTLASRKRKALKKERREALANGIAIEQLTGSDLTEAVWDAFYEFYMDTGGRKWGRPYLNRRFFGLIGERLGSRILLVMAKREGRYIAGALNFLGRRRIYGRNWGCIEEHPFLHFEVCYHQAIDYAIAHGLEVVEAGAQGQHKLARGYEPVTTHSVHYVAHPGLRRAIASYLESERAEVERMQDVLGDHTPFRRGERPGDAVDAEREDD